MGALRPWHLMALMCAGLTCTALVTAAVHLVMRFSRRR